MTKRMIIMLILVVVVFGGVFGMKAVMQKGMNDYISNMPIPPATISTASPQKMSWGNQVNATGTLMPFNGTQVTTEAAGIVESIHFESGDNVKAGAPLISLDASNEKAELQRLEAQAELAEQNLNRSKQLIGTGAVSQSEVDTAVSEANAARAAAKAQRAKIDQKNIRAPFSGVLGIRQINLGQYLAAGNAIVTLQALDPIYVDFSLPEQNLSVIKTGQTVDVTVDSYPDQVFPGVIEAIEPQINAGTSNFKIRAKLANSDLKLRPGVFANVVITLPGINEVVAIPRTAINYSSYGTSVFVVQKMKNPRPKPEKPSPMDPPYTDLEVIQRFVKTGESHGDFIAITDGLGVNDQIATSGLLKLKNQQPVIINNTVTPDVQLNPKTPLG